MDLAKVIRNAISTVDNTLESAQVPVVHHAWIGNGVTFGEPLYATPVTRMAIVEMKQRLIRLPDGQEVLQRAAIIFPRPIAANGATGRREPIDSRDKLVLPNGYTGPIHDVSGVVDPSTNSPYMLEVTLG